MGPGMGCNLVALCYHSPDHVSPRQCGIINAPYMPGKVSIPTCELCVSSLPFERLIPVIKNVAFAWRVLKRSSRSVV